MPSSERIARLKTFHFRITAGQWTHAEDRSQMNANETKSRNWEEWLFWGLVVYRTGHVLKLSLLHGSIPVYWDELPKSYCFPKPSFHLPNRNNSTDHQDAVRNTNEQNKRRLEAQRTMESWVDRAKKRF